MGGCSSQQKRKLQSSDILMAQTCLLNTDNNNFQESNNSALKKAKSKRSKFNPTSQFIEPNYQVIKNRIHRNNSLYSDTKQIFGINGLTNIGNTCYMNNILQCLTHTQPLTDFFMNNYQKSINKKNPIGSKGKIVEKYAKLQQQL